MKKLFLLMFFIVGCSSQQHDMQKSLLEKHNDARKHHHLRLLKIDLHLSVAAQIHAEWMAQNNRLDHKGKYGSEPWDRAKVAGAVFPEIGENIAYCDDSESDVFELWMDSPPHKENILGDYKFVGFGKAYGRNSVYWCALFGGE